VYIQVTTVRFPLYTYMKYDRVQRSKLLMVGGEDLKQYVEEVLRRSFTIEVMRQMNVDRYNRKRSKMQAYEQEEEELVLPKYGLGTSTFYQVLVGKQKHKTGICWHLVFTKTTANHRLSYNCVYTPTLAPNVGEAFKCISFKTVF
jgi:hypothetical protein